jgi:hypothetical protein
MKFLQNARLSVLAAVLAAVNPLAVTSTSAVAFITAPSLTTTVSTMAISTGAVLMSATLANACGGPCPDPDPEPEPEPEPEKPARTSDGRDKVCPVGDEAPVLASVGPLTEGDMVTRRDGDRVVSALGGDWRVVKVLSSKRVCVSKEKAVKKVAPAEKRECNAEVGYVCPDLYEEKYSTPTS